MITLISVPPFVTFKTEFETNFKSILDSGKTLYKVDLSKEELWETYLSGYPEEDGIRQSFTCNACKSFIHNHGGLVTLNDDLSTTSIWEGLTLPDPYGHVAAIMDALVTNAAISAVFVPQERTLGNSMVKGQNYELLESGDSLLRHHFYYEIPSSYQFKFDSGHKSVENFQMLGRALTGLTLDATETLLELAGQINTGSLGDIKPALLSWREVQVAYAKVPYDNFLWGMVTNFAACRIKNSALGTILEDLSSGMDVNIAIERFEKKVNGANYKRPNPIFTPRMVEEARKTIQELGFEGSLARRHAITQDIPVTQVLFVNASIRPQLAGGNIFDQLKIKATKPIQNLDKVEEIPVASFLSDVLPNVESLELFLEPQHKQNLVSLTAPVDPDAPSLFKWQNGLAFVYKGGVANAVMADRVKELGGKVDGELGFTLGWNFKGEEPENDLDAHCVDSSGFHIYFAKRRSYDTKGWLDIDIQRPGKDLAVENITWEKSVDGTYKFSVKNFHGTNKSGFQAEIRFFGNTYQFVYPHPVKTNQTIEVAVIEVLGRQIKFVQSLDMQVPQEEIWGIKTGEFHPVKLSCFSPNHWDSPGYGNKSLLFLLDGCASDEELRGFFNEFLPPALTPHRKVMEAIAASTAAPVVSANEQLSGVGFPLNSRTHFIVKVKSTNVQRVLKVIV